MNQLAQRISNRNILLIPMNSIAGELNIELSQRDNHQFDCLISSSRPLQATEIFTGKTIAQTLTTLPLLFNICSKAQSVTAVRAVESATQAPTSSQVESFREALISLENLREQCLRVAMDWPSFINEKGDSQFLSHINLGINQLMLSLDPKLVFSYQGNTTKPTLSIEPSLQKNWQDFINILSKEIFGSSSKKWADEISQNSSLEDWSSQHHTQTARFIHWLHLQPWKNAGSSSIVHLPDINDEKLVGTLLKQQTFTAQPSWNNQCFELSWYSRKQAKQSIFPTLQNSIYSRMTARLAEIVDLITKLDSFFIQHETLKATSSSVAGLAHSNAARGRLTHYVEIEKKTIHKLLILAPTEWNFHPNGVAQGSLCNIQADNPTEIKQQAKLIIHAIDPCVGYQLQVNKHPNNPLSVKERPSTREYQSNA